jgi:ribosome biogenesis protein SSF1/2
MVNGGGSRSAGQVTGRAPCNSDRRSRRPRVVQEPNKRKEATMPRRGGGKRRKRRTHAVAPPGASIDKVPRSLVFRRGKVPTGVRDLVPDMRRMFMPNTALNLKERKFNSMRDYVSVSAQLGISHFWAFSATDAGPYLRFAKVPQGPTLTFRMLEYSLASDVRNAQRRPVSLQDGDFAQAPLLVLNNFANAGMDQGVSLMAEMFRRAFPAVDVKSTRLKEMRRVILIDRDEGEDIVRIRHYVVRVQAAGLSKPVRKITVRGKVPKLAKFTDVAELVDGSGAPGAFSSDSEMDETPMPVTLPQPIKKLRRGANSTLRLVEVGPRLTLQLVKAQGGLCEGPVLYHRHVKKNEDEVKEDERRIAARLALKRKRTAEQNINVERKAEVKKAKKERYKKRLAGKLAAEAGGDVGSDADVENEDHGEDAGSEMEE